MKTALQLLALLFVSANANSQTATTLVDSLPHDGLQRTYRLYVPNVYNGTAAVPLVINMHGYGSNAWEQEQYGDFRPIADTANFIVVEPDGWVDGSGVTSWNAFNLPGTDDVGFISALIDTLAAHYNIDPQRVYATGMSNGGFMAYKLACALSNRVAAVASVAGTMDVFLIIGCTPTHPVPVLHIHGTADTTVPYAGSDLIVSVDTLIQHWVNFNHCNPTPAVSDVPNTNTQDGCTATHFVYNGGDNGSTVELFRVDGGGHSWPGAPININVTNMDFSASKEIWRFFSRYAITGALSVATASPLSGFYAFSPSPRLIQLQFLTGFKHNVTVLNGLGSVVYRGTVANDHSVTVGGPGVYVVTAVNEPTGTVTRKVLVY